MDSADAQLHFLGTENDAGMGEHPREREGPSSDG